MEQSVKSVDIVMNVLRGLFNGEYTDIPKIRLYYHYTEALLITLLNARRLGLLGNHIEKALVLMTQYGLISSEILAFYCHYKAQIEQEFRLDMISDRVTPHHIHVAHLVRELSISVNDIYLSEDKVSRDSTGSYYTPENFAREVVREAIRKYLNINGISTTPDAVKLLSKTRFADLSCGCGEFIKAIKIELQEQYKIDFNTICYNLYGVDIDPIALQITICDILETTEKSHWPEIISHFVLGNPLIDQPDEKSLEIKSNLFATGLFYNIDMGINTKKFFETARIDIVLGNPPWEKIRFEERKFFKPFLPEITSISQKNKRKIAIEKLKNQLPICFDWYTQLSGDYEVYKKIAKKHPYICRSLNGELNTYVLFTELSHNVISNNGVMTLLVKSAIATSPVNKPFFSHILGQKNLSSIYFFDNSSRIFDIDSRERFCVITCTHKTNPTFELIAGATQVEDLHTSERLSLSEKDIAIINPYSKMLPNISNNADIQLLISTHDRLPLFDEVFPNCHYGRLVHLTSHAHYIDTFSTQNNIPVYEGKFIERYDARFATFADMPDDMKYSAKAHAKKIPSIDGKKQLPECRYFIQKDFWERISSNYNKPYMLCWRSLTSTTNARTTLAMILPAMPTCQSIQFLQTGNAVDLLMMLALLNSMPFDYLVRLKMPGLDLTQSVIRQIPVPSRSTFHRQISFQNEELTIEQHILNRVIAILSDEPIVSSLFDGMNKPTSDIYKKPKKKLEKELDDLIFFAYEFTEIEIIKIKDSIKRKTDMLHLE